MTDETLLEAPPSKDAGEDSALARNRQTDDLSRTLHGLNNALHGMSLRLVLLRNDPETMAKHAATVEALRRGIRAAADEIDRLETLLVDPDGAP